MSDDEFDDVDRRLQELDERVQEEGQRCHNRSLIRLCREGRRLAKQEHRVIPYLSFSFHLINSADDVFEMRQGCEVAVEMIALLEDEERARTFQADLPEDEYEHTKWWMTSFAYKKLATLTGHTQGFNSDGMHQCIADGMNVCRRSGNPRETLHFREFAVEVYRAADDLEMALHFARGSLQLQSADDSNRKVASADDVVSILSLQGNLTAAVEMVLQGWQFCLEFHHPYLAKLNFLPLAREILSMAGRTDLLATFPVIAIKDELLDLPEDQVLRIPSEEECPHFKFLRDESQAIEAACRNDYDAAIHLLQPWDRTMSREQCLTRWFGVRCRLIAALRLAGRMDQARTLAKPCEEAARGAHDWLTLRRLERLLDESIPVNPLATVGPVDCGPFASESAALPGSDSAGEAALSEADSAEQDGAETPLSSVVQGFVERLRSSEGAPEVVAAIVQEMLDIEPDSVAHPVDAERLVHLIRFVAGHTRSGETLAWAQNLVTRFSANATLLSLYAALVANVQSLSDGGQDDPISGEPIAALFRRSLDLDRHSSANFARAGLYHLDQQEFGEAERCLARSFRLDRASGIVAASLAEVYAMTDRPRDGLEVLDMALREGCEDPQVAWRAALQANALQQYESALTYLDRFESQSPDQPWANHYRAFALLELNRPDEALVALEREREFNPEGDYHVHLQRATALGQLGRVDEFQRQVAELLTIPMSGVTYLSPTGLRRLFQRLSAVSAMLGTDSPALASLQEHIVGTGLAESDFFDDLRCSEDAAETEGIQYYNVVVRQPLASDWNNSCYCMPGEEDWEAFDVPWGVLATSEADARHRVLEWHRRCFSEPAEIVELECQEEKYNDYPGIVWQSSREEYTD
ncbi:MAG: hypothetical protein JSS49_22640 [Planctomycetes bacterium]|nr:hypothetical protein [Planctomycetota bacterium]